MDHDKEIDELETSIDELQERLRDLKNLAIAELDKAEPVIHTYTDQASATIKHNYDHVKGVGSTAAKKTNAYVKKNPWQAAALAAGLGAVVASIINRGKSGRK